MEEFQQMNQQLKRMGIDFGSIGKAGNSALPPLPPSDPFSLQKNRYDGFYKYGARDFWKESEMDARPVDDFKECRHYFMKQKNEIVCKLCHVGWIVPESFHAQDGKLYDGEQHLQFAI